MTTQQEVGYYICVEKETGAYDGFYMEKAIAEHMAGFHQALWKGSNWDTKVSFKGDVVSSRFHADSAMRKNLERLYGEKDYKAADEYDRLSQAV